MEIRTGYNLLRMMTKQEAKIRALSFIWGWASYLHELADIGELGDHLEEDVLVGNLTREEAFLVQKMAIHEADIIWRKKERIRRNAGLPVETISARTMALMKLKDDKDE